MINKENKIKKIEKKAGKWVEVEESEIDKDLIVQRLDFWKKEQVRKLEEVRVETQVHIDRLESWLAQVNT